MIGKLAVAAALAISCTTPAMAAPFQDAANRVWELSFPGGRQFDQMAAGFDPLTGDAFDQSGLRWATAAEVHEFHSMIGAQDFFSHFACTYSTNACNPSLSMWMPNPDDGPVPFGFNVFGGVVREPIRMGQFIGSPEQPLQTNVYFYSNWDLVGYAGPQEDWALVFGPLQGSGMMIPLDGEITQDGMWVYRFVPAPGTVGLAILGLLAMGPVVGRRKAAVLARDAAAA